MGACVWMCVLESAPRRYDFGVLLLSLDHIERIYDKAAQLAQGPEVLDLGCDTGNLALRLAARGLHVTGVDLSPEMIELARRRAPAPLPPRRKSHDQNHGSLRENAATGF